MSIVPLPIFEQDADPSRRDAPTDEEIYARLSPPATIVVRFGAMRMVGEFPYDGEAKPGCGTKLVVRTPRGTEVADMLTTTCSNSGCSKSISRQEMLEYIENSGGRDYPFHEHGRVLRVATIDDLNRWSALQATKHETLRRAREIAAAEGFAAKLVDVEPIFGGEMMTVFVLSEERVDGRELARTLSASFATRVEIRQVGARDEARLVADYERCGQHCCCRNFLKVLRPVSMKSAKVQKATLDPMKISGRCGRLMCCLRYEDQTYDELRKRLPKHKSRVGTPEGPGIVVDSKILVQLVLVALEGSDRTVAVAVEDLCDPDAAPRPASEDPLRGLTEAQVQRRGARRGGAGGRAPDERRTTQAGTDADKQAARARPGRAAPPDPQEAFRRRDAEAEQRARRPGDGAPGERPPPPEGAPRKKKKRRGRPRGKRRRDDGAPPE